MESPIKVGNLLSFAKSFRNAQKQDLRLTVFVDPRSADEHITALCDLLRPATRRSQVFVQVMSGDVALDTARLNSVRKSSAQVLLCARSADIADLLPLPAATCVVVGEELRSEAAGFLGLSILDVVSFRSGDMQEQLADWLSTSLSAKRLTLAADFSFVQKTVMRDILSATAWQNAIIALVPFTHGADMPVLVANQVKMLFQLALASGLKLDLKRAPEVAVTGAAALGSRALANRAFFPFPPARWLARGAIAFATTEALGRAACLYYEQLAAREREQALLTGAERRAVGGGVHLNPTQALLKLLGSGDTAASATKA